MKTMTAVLRQAARGVRAWVGGHGRPILSALLRCLGAMAT
jgi:hypothetical protein